MGAGVTAIVRNNFVETSETATTSNGVNGDDEMSEPSGNWTPALTFVPGQVQ
ncbi:MAG: hypothetical protein JKY65_00645 [Planctomycetes bacterium]|nr:hypothetical protein [Planctomycetota bacterium]